MTKIAIIGTGNVGSALGSSAARAGYEVVFAGQDAAKAQAVAESAGATAATSARDAAAAADIVVLAVPYAAVEQLAAELAPVVDGKVVIDATNPLKADYTGLATPAGTSGAELLARALPNARLVKGFNTVFAGIQADAGARSETPDALFATDDEDARRTVAELAESIGFRPVWVGPLSASRELEALAWLNIRLQLINGGAWNTAIKLVDAPDKALAA
jgi:8-hydroxy-5-deazaflavin:NADPH oxidoreductase